METFIKVLLVIVILSLAASCMDKPAAETRILDGTSWVLTEIKSTSPIAGVEVTLQFKEGQASGSAGCNSYSAPYEQKDGKITFGMMVSTVMACEQERMDLETDYLQALSSAHSYQIDGNQLKIFTDSGESLTFKES